MLVDASYLAWVRPTRRVHFALSAAMTLTGVILAVFGIAGSRDAAPATAVVDRIADTSVLNGGTGATPPGAALLIPPSASPVPSPEASSEVSHGKRPGPAPAASPSPWASPSTRPHPHPHPHPRPRPVPSASAVRTAATVPSVPNAQPVANTPGTIRNPPHPLPAADAPHPPRPSH